MNSRPAPFDITNMYCNTPTTELKSIIGNTLKTKHTDEKQKDIMSIYDIITTQNCFTHNNTFCQQTSGLAMEPSSTAKLFEIISAIYGIKLYCIVR
jgi:hypothetical protein